MTAAERQAHVAWESDEERDDVPVDTDWEIFAGDPRVTCRTCRGKFLMVEDKGSTVDYQVLDGEPDGERARAHGFVTRRAGDGLQVAIDSARHAAKLAADEVLDADETRKQRALERCGCGRQLVREQLASFDVGGEGG